MRGRWEEVGSRGSEGSRIGRERVGEWGRVWRSRGGTATTLARARSRPEGATSQGREEWESAQELEWEERC